MTIETIIIGGYLGSGKSSLVNQMMALYSKDTTGLIINDLAPVNIDSEQVVQGGLQVGIQDGCICCAITSTLGDALDWMASSYPTLERIIVEASGVGVPGRIAFHAYGRPNLTVRSIVTVVDASNFGSRVDDKYVGQLVRDQVATADLIVVNKIDLATEPQLAHVESLIRSINPLLPMMRAYHAAVAPELIAAKTHHRPISPKALPSNFKATEVVGSGPGGFKTLVMRRRKLVDGEKFRMSIGLLSAVAERIKGVVVTKEEPYSATLVQAVDGNVEFTPAALGASYGESVLVFILKGTDVEVRKQEALVKTQLTTDDWRLSSSVS